MIHMKSTKDNVCIKILFFIYITLFQDYIPIIREGRWFRFLYLFVGNLIWFLPFGAALIYFRKVTRVWKAAFCGLALSLVIETMQYIFGTGISEVDDLLLNTLGTWLGAAIIAKWKMAKKGEHLT